MRKRQLFYDLLLFSSVLGVTLTSQVQLSHHSTFNFSTTAKADTTSDSDTGVTAEITKYSDMDNVLSLTGTSAKEDQDNRIANLTSIATMLETNANKISSTMMLGLKR